MGKKRRAINRINKFGKKAFNFLDKVDGVDDGLLSLTRTGESRAEIKDFTLTDNENQTIAFVTSVFGSATHVQYDSDAEGKAVAVSRGVKMGRKRSYSIHQIEEIKAMRRSQRGYGSIAKSLGMSKSTIQRFCVREGI